MAYHLYIRHRGKSNTYSCDKFYVLSQKLFLFNVQKNGILRQIIFNITKDLYFDILPDVRIKREQYKGNLN